MSFLLKLNLYFAFLYIIFMYREMFFIHSMTIKEKEYQIKQTIRALFLWEQITGKSFEIKTTLDNYLYFYCLLLANNPDFMGWDEFINTLDEDPTILIQLSKALTQQQELEKILYPEDSDSDKKKE